MSAHQDSFVTQTVPVVDVYLHKHQATASSHATRAYARCSGGRTMSLCFIVRPPGLEPGTLGLKGRCSTS